MPKRRNGNGKGNDKNELAERRGLSQTEYTKIQRENLAQEEGYENNTDRMRDKRETKAVQEGFECHSEGEKLKREIRKFIKTKAEEYARYRLSDKVPNYGSREGRLIHQAILATIPEEGTSIALGTRIELVKEWIEENISTASKTDKGSHLESCDTKKLDASEEKSCKHKSPQDKIRRKLGKWIHKTYTKSHPHFIIKTDYDKNQSYFSMLEYMAINHVNPTIDPTNITPAFDAIKAWVRNNIHTITTDTINQYIENNIRQSSEFPSQTPLLVPKKRRERTGRDELSQPQKKQDTTKWGHPLTPQKKCYHHHKKQTGMKVIFQSI